MSRYRMNSHEVEVHKVVNIQPLLGRGGSSLMSPDQGLALILDDGQKINWLAESKQPAPSAGDFLIEDSALGTSILIPAAKFNELFSEVSE